MGGIKGQPTPKPSDLSSPVPDASGGADPFADLATAGADPFGDLAAGGAAAPPVTDQPLPDEGQSVGGQMLDAAGRALDYVGGNVRTAGATAAGMVQQAVQGKNPLDQQITTDADVKAALKGKAPGAGEYLKRLGVSEGGSMNLPGIGRVTLRGAEGLALDILTDPLTLITKAIKGAPYIAKLLEAPGRASEALGEAVYKSAITAKDARKAKVAGEALVELGAPAGGAAKLEQHIAQAANTMGNIRQGLYDQFNQLGGKLDVTDSTFKNAQGVIKNLRQNPTLAPLADEFEAMINQYKGQGFVPIEQMSMWKTQLYDSLPKGAFTGARLGSPGKMFKSALAKDFKVAIVDGGNKIAKGLGDAIDHVNDKWGALLEAKPMKDPLGGTLGKAIDATALAFGGLPGLVKKKALEVAIGPHGRTITGKALMQAGKTDFVNKLSRQAIAQAAGKQTGSEE